jgi:RNA polymerase sigma-70 factor (ECF subfamily)
MSSEAALPFPQALVEADIAPDEVAAEPVVPDALEHDAKVILSDEELLQAVGKGNKQALGMLFQRHGRSVLHVAWRILRDEGEADDLRQDVFLYVYQRASSFNPGKASAASWIIQIAYHRAIDRRRLLSVRQHYQSEELDEQGSGALFTQPSTDQIDGKAILKKLRSQLSTEQQQTLELHFFEGYSFREIAEQSGQSVSNVRHHYYRALDRLRASLFSKKRG